MILLRLLNACVLGGAPHGFQSAGLCSTNRAGLPGIIDFPLYAFVKRTRTNQKINKISGRMVRTKYKVVLNKAGDRYFPSPTVESNLSGRFDPPKKKDPAAINSPKHMRQRCREMRLTPATPPDSGTILRWALPPLRHKLSKRPRKNLRPRREQRKFPSRSLR